MNNGLTASRSFPSRSFSRGFVPFERLYGDFSQLCDALLGGSLAPAQSTAAQSDQGFMPVMNIWEEDDHYFVEAELPGVSPEAVEVTLEGRELRIRGEKKWEETEQKKQLHRKETFHGKFERALRFPADVNPEGVEAKSQDGVLRIKVKKSEAAKLKKIQIS